MGNWERMAGRRSCRAEAGAGAMEYIATVVVAAVLVGGVVLALGGGGRVLAAASTAVCQILGGGCAAAPGDADEGVVGALPSCEVYTQGYDLHGEVTVFSINLGGDGSLTLSQQVLPDGSEQWLVQEAGQGQLGLHALLGEKGRFGLGQGLNAEARAQLVGGGGRTFAFDSEQDAREFMEAAALQPAKELAATVVPLPRDAEMWVADLVTGTSYEPPGEPVSYYAEVGNRVSAGAEASAGDAGLALSGGYGGVLGVEYQPATDGQEERTTYYYRGTQELGVELNVLGRGPDGDYDGEIVLAVSVDADGDPASARIEAAGTLHGGFFLAGNEDVPLGRIPNGNASIGVDAGALVNGRLALEMDLTQPENLTALADVTQSVGLPVLTDHGTPGYQDPAEAVGALRERFTDGGPAEGATITGQVFTGAESTLEVGSGQVTWSPSAAVAAATPPSPRRPLRTTTPPAPGSCSGRGAAAPETGVVGSGSSRIPSRGGP